MMSPTFLDVDLKQFVANNKANSLYYRPIERTGDLLKGSPIFSKGDSSKLRAEIYIAPPRVALGALPVKALNCFQTQLNLAAVPTAQDIVSLELGKLIETYGGETAPSENLLKADLQQKGFTGEIIQAAKRLNQARLDPIDRAILSRTNLAIYGFYRAIEGLDVEDVDGIFTNVLESLTKIKRHLNRVLVDMVIKAQHLEASLEERNYLKQKFADRTFSYENNEVSQAILKAYRQLKSGGSLIETINEFLDSDLITLPININREVLIQTMVAYLVDSGFNPDAIDFEEEEPVVKPEPQEYKVKGIIVDQQGQPVVDVRVRAVDQDFTSENPLGQETFTDQQGRYHIFYRKEDFVIDGKESGGADIIIYVLDKAGNTLLRSKTYRNSPKSRIINLEIGEDAQMAPEHNTPAINIE